MAYPLYTTVTKSAEQVRSDYLRTMNNGLRGQGIANPNTGPGSDEYIKATAIGNEMAVVHANASIQTDATMPDTATGPNLDRWLALFNQSRRQAIGSAGNVSAPCSVTTPVLVVQGVQLTDTNGLRFQVAVGGNYTATAGYLYIPVTAVDTGSQTNHQNGDPLKWQNAPPFCAPTATVGAVGGSDGLTGGSDSEVGIDDPPRARLLQLLAAPPTGGNAGDVVTWALASSPYVQGAWCYPALLGPGTVFFTTSQLPQTVGPFNSSSKNRSIASSILVGTIIPYVQGKLPAYAVCVGSTVTNVPADIAVLLSIPSAPTASPPGPGGGWLDGTPWPSSLGGTSPVTVSSVTSSLSFTVNAATPPTPGVSHIAWVSPTNWTLYTATVLSYSGSPGAYALVVDTPMTGIAAGSFIFPQSVNQANYLAACLAAFALLGPGEWTTNSAVLARAFRHPTPAFQWPNALNAVFLKQGFINAGPEVADANWVYRSVGSGPPTPPSSITLDNNNNLTSASPGLYVPRNLSWYAS